jgi:hypothetical protein
LASGRARSLVEIARREGLTKRYVTRLTKLAFKAPMIGGGIVEGLSPGQINLQALMDGRLAVPNDWSAQQKILQDRQTVRESLGQ